MFLKAKYTSGQLARNNLTGINWFGAAVKNDQAIYEALTRCAPPKEAAILWELFLVPTVAIEPSFLRNLRQIAVQLDMLTDTLFMGKVCLDMSDEGKCKEYAARVGMKLGEAATPDLVATTGRTLCDGALFNYAEIRHRMGAPTQGFYEWTERIWGAFWNAFNQARPRITGTPLPDRTAVRLGLNTYGRSRTMAGSKENADEFKLESFLTMRSSRFGFGPERLVNMIEWPAEMLDQRPSNRIFFQPCPAEAFADSHDKTGQYLRACALVFRYLQVRYGDARVFWMNNGYWNGEPLEIESWPRVETLLSMEVSRAELHREAGEVLIESATTHPYRWRVAMEPGATWDSVPLVLAG